MCGTWRIYFNKYMQCAYVILKRTQIVTTHSHSPALTLALTSTLTHQHSHSLTTITHTHTHGTPLSEKSF